MGVMVVLILALICTVLLGLGFILVKWIALQIGGLIFVCVLCFVFLVLMYLFGDDVYE